MFLGRRRTPIVAPVTANGIRYEVYLGNFSRFDNQRGAIAAVDPATEEELWAALVYDTALDPRWETDGQQVFITELRLEEHDTKLIVVNERRRTFVVDLATRAISERL